MDYNINNDVIRWRISIFTICIKLIACIFTLALNGFEILTFKIVDLENLGQDHGVQNGNDTIPMANINVYKDHNPHFLR